MKIKRDEFKDSVKFGNQVLGRDVCRFNFYENVSKKRGGREELGAKIQGPAGIINYPLPPFFLLIRGLHRAPSVSSSRSIVKPIYQPTKGTSTRTHATPPNLNSTDRQDFGKKQRTSQKLRPATRVGILDPWYQAAAHGTLFQIHMKLMSRKEK